MPKIAGPPLTKVTLNLFEADVEWFKRRYGQGYSELMRQAIQTYVRNVTQAEQEYERANSWLTR